MAGKTEISLSIRTMNAAPTQDKNVTLPLYFLQWDFSGQARFYFSVTQGPGRTNVGNYTLVRRVWRK